ncbi:MAG: GAF domain-containing protein [Actinomycetota bacterium]|nr:GAF domain-containing protein [Actinomycetota bacterium]
MKPVPETEQALTRLLSYGDAGASANLLAMGERAKEIVPECVGLSLAVLEGGLTFTLVATAEEAAILDAVQYLDGGPCVTAVDRQERYDVNQSDLMDENLWQMYAQASAAAGVASSLSLPIVRQGRTVGGVNLYASTSDAFQGHHAELASALGASAEDAVINADLAFSTRLEAAKATSRLADQGDIDIAAGIIAASQEVDIATAQTRLRQAAARAGITEAQAARALRHIRAE